ncbi:MAG: (2Fe-2S)-binding protein [Flavobacteriales bacterium]|nr:(2Fe-2S)-binding protein [Flavobacteriales bacterium]
MQKNISLSINGNKISTTKSKTIVEAAEDNGIYIPTLCFLKGKLDHSNCRICTVKVDGYHKPACSTLVADNMDVITNSDELEELRKYIIELLFSTGNHICAVCQKSGDCELQALAYKYKLLFSRFEHLYPNKGIDTTSSDKIIMDKSRCILCQRCIQAIKDKDGNPFFVLQGRSNALEVVFDKEMNDIFTQEDAIEAVKQCPVGCILSKESAAFETPIGRRQFDKTEIGNKEV